MVRSRARPRHRRGLVTAVLLAAALMAGAAAAAYYGPGAALIVQTAGIGGALGRAAAAFDHPHRERLVSVPTRHGAVRARLFTPVDGFDLTVVLGPGIHAAGIDEPRLLGFARNLAARGLAVVTPDLPLLASYRIEEEATDRLEDAARWVLDQPELSPRGRVGMMGISFAGGLTVAAAGREAVRDDVAFVLSLGGHGDFPRVLRYLCTGELPDGTYRRPHDYGVVVILLNVIDRLVPPAQVEPLRRAVLTFLNASHLAMVDQDAAREEFERARLLQSKLPEPSATLMRHVNERDVPALGAILLPFIDEYGNAPSLSPGRSPAPRAPVYLLHGTDDTVIPAMESERLATDLAAQTEVHLLITPLIVHAEVSSPSQAWEVWRLIAFWADALHE